MKLNVLGLRMISLDKRSLYRKERVECFIFLEILTKSRNKQNQPIKTDS